MSTEPTAADPVGRRRRGRAITVAVAVLAAIVIRLTAEMADADMVTAFEGQDPMNVNLALVISTSLLVGLASWAALAILERLTSHAATAWTALAVVVLLLSFGPVFLADVTSGTRVTLALTHLIVGVVLIGGMRRTFSGAVSRPVSGQPS